MSSNLYTIGYRGRSPEWLYKEIVKHKIRTVLDIRINPRSNKKEYHKEYLCEFFKKRGILYIHYFKGGNPFYKHRMHDSLENSYRPYIRENHISLDFLSFLRRMYRSEYWPAVLLCACKDHNKCHRRILTEEVKSESSGKLNIIALPIKTINSQNNLF